MPLAFLGKLSSLESNNQLAMIDVAALFSNSALRPCCFWPPWWRLANFSECQWEYRGCRQPPFFFKIKWTINIDKTMIEHKIHGNEGRMTMMPTIVSPAASGPLDLDAWYHMACQDHSTLSDFLLFVGSIVHRSVNLSTFQFKETTLLAIIFIM